jgi:hypothetical protein
MEIAGSRKETKREFAIFLALAAANALWSGFLDLLTNGDVSAVKKLTESMHVHFGAPDYALLGLLIVVIAGPLLCFIRQPKNRAESIAIGLAAFVAFNINPYQDPNIPATDNVPNVDPRITINFEYPPNLERVPEYISVKLVDRDTRRVISKQYVSDSRELHLDLDPGDYRLELEAAGIRTVSAPLNVGDADANYTLSLVGSGVPINIQKLYGPDETQLMPAE